jgi:hypothetical protein
LAYLDASFTPLYYAKASVVTRPVEYNRLAIDLLDDEYVRVDVQLVANF